MSSVTPNSSSIAFASAMVRRSPPAYAIRNLVIRGPFGPGRWPDRGRRWILPECPPPSRIGCRLVECPDTFRGLHAGTSPRNGLHYHADPLRIHPYFVG